jgi:hypothetical protein
VEAKPGKDLTRLWLFGHPALRREGFAFCQPFFYGKSGGEWQAVPRSSVPVGRRWPAHERHGSGLVFVRGIVISSGWCAGLTAVMTLPSQVANPKQRISHGGYLHGSAGVRGQITPGLGGSEFANCRRRWETETSRLLCPVTRRRPRSLLAAEQAEGLLITTVFDQSCERSVLLVWCTCTRHGIVQ